MPPSKTKMLALAACIVLAPSVALAQAAVSPDQPVARSDGAMERGAAGAIQGTDSDGPSSRSTPNALTGPGSPGTTGTGAAGTGPTGTMAAPGR